MRTLSNIGYFVAVLGSVLLFDAVALHCPDASVLPRIISAGLLLMAPAVFWRSR
jgi:hypothetical protein